MKPILDKDLIRHAPEFRKALESGHFEQTADGILFPRAHVMAAGMYFHDVNGLDEQTDKNLLTDQGLMYLLGVGFGATAKLSGWYLALYSAAVNPAAGWTAANFTATATEIVSQTEGYAETTRPVFTAGAPAANAIDNLAARAAFTIVTASTLTVNGAVLVSSNVRGGTAGVLASATKFASPRTLSNTDVFNCGYKVDLVSV